MVPKIDWIFDICGFEYRKWINKTSETTKKRKRLSLVYTWISHVPVDQTRHCCCTSWNRLLRIACWPSMVPSRPDSPGCRRGFGRLCTTVLSGSKRGREKKERMWSCCPCPCELNSWTENTYLGILWGIVAGWELFVFIWHGHRLVENFLSTIQSIVVECSFGEHQNVDIFTARLINDFSILP